MSNQIKSVFVIILIVVLLFLFLGGIRSAIKIFRASIIGFVAYSMASLIIFASIIALFNYSRITDVNVKLEKVSEITVSDEFTDEYWYCIYSISHPFLSSPLESYNTQFPYVKTSDSFPETDFTKYTYLISRGREVEKLTYNVWNCHGTPILDWGLSTKWGNVEYSSELKEQKIYVYRFPKKAVDNIELTDYR